MSASLDHDRKDVVSPSDPASELAGLLRTLRLSRPTRLTQRPLATALGLSSPASVSSWENVEKPVTPAENVLEQIARIYATPSSVIDEKVRIPELAELSVDEKAEYDRLFARFRELRDLIARAESGDRPNPWQFAEGDVRIFCGKLDEQYTPKYASGDELNYIAACAYADMDSLVELFGHLRAENPTTDVQFDLVQRMESPDLQAHLVLLGGLAWMGNGAKLLLSPDIPVRQIDDPEGALVGIGEVFEIKLPDGKTKVVGPRMIADSDSTPGKIVEDVGFFMRTQGPNTARTLTVCSGVFTRGTYGAVRMLTDRTDPDLHRSNVEYIARRLSKTETYGMLVRVKTHDHAVGTPDLRDPSNILFEFSSPS